jgi:hypothetical protein
MCVTKKRQEHVSRPSNAMGHGADKSSPPPLRHRKYTMSFFFNQPKRQAQYPHGP